MSNPVDPLQDLRDVHMPDPISWWPPAYGWWMIIMLFIVVIGIGVWAAARYRQSRFRRLALTRLNQVKQQYAMDANEQLAIIQLSQLVRRYALAMFPRSEVAGLSGQSWLEFLDQVGKAHLFSDGPGQILRSSPYQSRFGSSLARLFPLIEQWIRQVPLPSRRIAA